jgi:hypothetical protein
MNFTIGQKRHEGSEVPMETRAYSLLWSKNDLKAFLAWGVTDL